MNREIKFRGKKIDNGEWVYGDLFRSHPEHHSPSVSISTDEFHPVGYGSKTFYEVYEDTVGQFCSLHDKNWKEIYEGDIVKFHYFFGTLGDGMGFVESEHELTGVITWLEYGWGLDAIKGEHWNGYTGYKDGEGSSNILGLYEMNESSIHEESFEVIGNIFENPELLTDAVITSPDALGQRQPKDRKELKP